MPQRNDRSRSTPTTSPKNNSWFRMQAGHQSDADIYIYDEIGFWGVTAKQFISDLNALGVGHCDGGKPGHYAGKLLHDDS